MDTSKPLDKENAVVINNLLPALKLFWRRKEFDSIQKSEDNNDNKELRIRGALIIIIDSKDKEEQLKKCIECLKNNQTINEKYDTVRMECDGIIKEADELSSVIKLKLVDQYKK